jgi:HEAT repeat protein
MELGVLGHKRAVEPLINMLYREVWWSGRLVAAESLSKIGDSRAVTPLEEALVDFDSRVRKASAEALARLGYPAWQEIVTGDNFYNNDFERLGSCNDKRAVELLITALGDNDSRVREDAANILLTRQLILPKYSEICYITFHGKDRHTQA